MGNFWLRAGAAVFGFLWGWGESFGIGGSLLATLAPNPDPTYSIGMGGGFWFGISSLLILFWPLGGLLGTIVASSRLWSYYSWSLQWLWQGNQWRELFDFGIMDGLSHFFAPAVLGAFNAFSIWHLVQYFRGVHGLEPLVLPRPIRNLWSRFWGFFTHHWKEATLQ